MRRLRCAVLVGFVLLGVTSTAHAGPLSWWAWLDELSGPGPFEGIHIPGPPILCFAMVAGDDGVRTQRWGGVASSIEGRRTGVCPAVEREGVRPVVQVSTEFTWYHSTRNKLAPAGLEEDERYEVTERVIGLIAYYKPLRGVDLGAGATYHWFTGEGVTGDYSFWRPAVSLRARVRPLTWVPAWKQNRVAAALGLYTGLDQMVATFTNDDFKSNRPFESRNDTRQMKVHVLLDASALIW